MKAYGLLESASVKIQTLKTAIESATLLLRVDDIVSARRESCLSLVKETHTDMHTQDQVRRSSRAVCRLWASLERELSSSRSNRCT